jgi:hypothetical protein
VLPTAQSVICVKNAKMEAACSSEMLVPAEQDA